MNILELAAKISLDTSELDDGLSSVASKISSVGSKIGTAAVAVTGAAAAGVTAITKLAVDGYADYEQLVGGVETLFGSGGQSIEEYAESMGSSVSAVEDEYNSLMTAQNTVMQNAADAFETAGLSANEYMEQATSVAASLTNALGGDTEKAAEMVDVAITDMADNANKMGTDMEAIQNAYNGFSKQNYTMLDNLKLGYGGTQEEMKRLIQDASEMTDIQEQLGVTVDESSLSFDNIVSAIHVMQTSMGIAGTTSKEAATTIQGSFAMMKSAWSNLVTGMATDGADVKSLASDLVDSASTYAKNIIPVIGQALQGLGTALTEIAPMLVAKIPSLINELLPKFINATAKMVKGIVTALPSILASIGNVLPSLLANIITSSLKNLDAVLGTSISDTVQNVWDKIQEVISSIDFTSIIENLKTILTSISDTVQNVWDVIWIIISGAHSYFIEAFNGVADTVMWFVDQVTTNGTAINTVIQGLQTVVSFAFETISGIISNFVALFQMSGESIANNGLSVQTVFENIKQAIQNVAEILAWVVEQCNTDGTILNTIVTSLRDIITQTIAIITGIISTFILFLSGDFSGAWESLKNTIGLVWDAIKTNISNAMDLIKSVISTGINAASNVISSVLNSIKQSFVNTFETAKNIVQNAIERIKSFFNFSWSLPDIKLPYFSIEGNFSLNPPSIPYFSVAWHKKAMDQPYMLDTATIFGMSGGSYLGGGEAGSEMIYGKDALMNDIRSATNGNEQINLLSSIHALLTTIMQQMNNQQIVLDSEILVGNIAPKMNKEMGRIANLGVVL